jgi:hypothetical protein
VLLFNSTIYRIQFSAQLAQGEKITMPKAKKKAVKKVAKKVAKKAKKK